MKPIKKPRLHRAWIIMVGCILLQAGGTGILGNCRSIFFSSITSELGLGNGAMSLFSTILTISSALSMSVVSSLYGKVNIRVLLTGMSVLGVGCFALQSQLTAIWQWYVMAPFFGIACGGLMTVPATIIINHWFHERAGLALGLALCASGIAGAICNPVCTALIGLLGWRTAVMVTAGISLALLLPATAVILRLKPSDVGCTPYGEPADARQNEPVSGNTSGTGIPSNDNEPAPVASTGRDTSSAGQDAPLAGRPLVFVLLLLIGLVLAASIQILYQISLYCSQEGLSLTVAGTLTSLVMVGNTAGKLILGAVNDRKGPWFTIGGGCLLVIFAMLGYASCVPSVMVICSPVIGISYSMLAMAPSLFCKRIYAAHYQHRYSLIMTICTLGGAAISSLFGFLSDLLGSYRPLYVALSFSLALCVAIIMSLRHMEKQAATAG